MSFKLQVAANTLVQLLGKAITALSTAGVTILLASSYGTLGFGEFTKIFSFVALFYLAVDFGINAITIRQAQEEKRDVFQTAMGLRIVLSVFWIFVAFSILVFLPFNATTNTGFTPLSKLGIILFLPTIMTQALFVSANAYFQKKLRYDLSVMASSIGSLTTLLLVYLLTRSGAPLLITLTSYIIGSLLTATVSLFLAGWTTFFGRWNTQSMTRLFWDAFPLGLTLLFNLVYFRIDTLILTAYRSTAEVGIYGLAYRFFELPLTIPTFFMNAVYPVLLFKKTQGHTHVRRLMKQAGFLLGISSLLFILAGIYLSPWIAWIDPSFRDSIFVFRLLLLSLPAFFLSSLFMWVLIAEGKTTILCGIYAFALLINVGLNLLFIPSFGYVAAAITTGVSEALVFVMTGYVSIRTLKSI